MTENTKANVLVLDDEASIRQSLCDYFEDFEYNVKEAETGEDAIEVVKNNPIDIVIVDIRLPGMDGNAFIMAVHKIKPNVKFIVHTGSVNYQLVAGVKDAGVTEREVFLKPVPDIEKFVQTIERLTLA